MKIAVFGLGKLGSVMAAVYAAAGHEVVGVDISAEYVAAINSGVAPFSEPSLQDLLDEVGSRISATTEVSVALRDSEVSYIIVPTPSDDEGIFTNKYVNQVLSDIGEELRTSERRHTIVICSTVMPGSCDGDLTAVLEMASGKIVGKEIGLVYSPEFIALGSIVRDMHFPDTILIGESDAESGAIAEKNALSVAKNTPSVQRMNLVNAEIVKLSINTFVTTKISFANMLSEICDHMPGADVDVVTEAVGSDSRIGTKYLRGALGYGGPCFPRDNVALTRLADSFGVDAAIPRATDAINNRQSARVLELVSQMTEPGATVAILGLSYKPDTSVCEMSQGVELANKLLAVGFTVVAHDPQANRSTAPNLNSGVEFISELDGAVSRASTVVLTTAWPEFKSLTSEQLHGKFVVDAWGILGSELPTSRLGKLQSSVKCKSMANQDV
jgi:UDPglucose 6-dehydrogenase